MNLIYQFGYLMGCRWDRVGGHRFACIEWVISAQSRLTFRGNNQKVTLLILSSAGPYTSLKNPHAVSILEGTKVSFFRLSSSSLPFALPYSIVIAYWFGLSLKRSYFTFFLSGFASVLAARCLNPLNSLFRHARHTPIFAFSHVLIRLVARRGVSFWLKEMVHAEVWSTERELDKQV